MKTISMLEFRRDAESIIRRTTQGQRMVLTYRGKPVMRLEPVAENTPDRDDPFYRLPQLADAAGKDLTNAEMDRIVYGS